MRSFGFVTSYRHAALLLELASTHLKSWLDLSCIKITKSSELDGRWKILFQLVSALQYMHGQAILHPDIKTNNILVFECSNQPPVFKLADLGLAQSMHLDLIAVAANAVYTPHLRPPEVLLAGSEVVKIEGSSDTFALGCCVYNIFRTSTTGSLLFPRKELVELMLSAQQCNGAVAAYKFFKQYRDARLDGATRSLDVLPG